MKNYSEESRASDRAWIEKQKEAAKQRTDMSMGTSLLFGVIGIIIVIAVIFG